GGTVTSADIAPVTLGFDEQILLAKVDHRLSDGGVTMGMILHRISDDIGHFVKASVIHLFKRMHDAALYGLQAVLNARDRPLQDYVGSVLQKPVFVQSVEGNGMHRVSALSVAPSVCSSARIY